MTDVGQQTGPSQAQIVTYPSRTVRPIPSFAFTSPPGWVAEDAPDCLVVIRTPVEVDDFWANALLSHDRVPKAVTLEEAAKFSFARLQQQSPDVVVRLERVARFDDNVVYLRGVELNAPRSDRKLGQLHALFLAPEVADANTVDLFQFIGTAAVESMERMGPIFATVVSSFRFT